MIARSVLGQTRDRACAPPYPPGYA